VGISSKPSLRSGIERRAGCEVRGGSTIAQSLSRLGLIDEYRLIVHPVALASGSPLFGDRVDLELGDSRVFATGAVALTYKAAGGDE
jgi:dihydrofolate reductase